MYDGDKAGEGERALLARGVAKHGKYIFAVPTSFCVRRDNVAR